MSDPDYVISIQHGYVLVEDPPNYEVLWSEQPRKLQAVAAACSEAGTRKVLVRGTNAKVRLTTAELFAFGESVGELKLRIAVVNLDDAPVEDSKFFENVANNRGSHLGLFDNEEDAREWLGI